MTTYPLPKPAYTRIGFDATIGNTPSLRTSVPVTVSGVEVFTAEQMQAAYAAGLAEGRKVTEEWKMAPNEPNERMGDAGFQAGAKSSFAAHMIYRAMIAASPEPKP